MQPGRQDTFMKIRSGARPPLGGFLVAAVLCSMSCDSPGVRQRASTSHSAGGPPVKIRAFYARETAILERGKTLLCYGVSDAKSVRIDPSVEGVSPALSRCLEVQPPAETRYTLTAEGADGTTVSQSAIVRVGADAETLPKIISFRIEGTQKDYAGRTL